MVDVFDKIPQIGGLIMGIDNEDQLRKKLNIECKDEKKGFQAYKLLRYILATNRSTIRQLKAEERFELPEGIQGLFDQYVLISQDPKKERKFA
jgi:hypothetical protein